MDTHRLLSNDASVDVIGLAQSDMRNFDVSAANSKYVVDVRSDVGQVQKLEMNGGLDCKGILEKLEKTLPEFIYVVNSEESTILYRSRDFIAELGYPTDTAAKGLLFLRDLLHPDDREAFREHRTAVLGTTSDDVINSTLRVRTTNEEWRWIEVRSVAYRRYISGKVTEVLRTINDISVQMRHESELREKVRQLRFTQTELRDRQEQLQELNDRLATLATTDGLTGLYNFRAFHEKLAEETRRSRRYGYPLSVVFTDVDDFKAYNDRFGHPAGDERLRLFARMLTEDSRDTDFVARYGGEEFAMILVNTGAQDAAKCAQRIIDHLNQEKGTKRLTASFGCVQLEPEDMSKDDLIRRADECLYSAKRQGKNRVVVSTHDSRPVGTTY